MFRLALASLVFPLVGCVAADGAGDEAIYVVKAVAANDSCSFSATDTEPYIGHGEINVFSPNPYLIYPQLRSRIVTSNAAEQEMKTIQVHGARVTLDFKDKTIGSVVSAANKKFQTLFTAPLAPNEGSVTDTRFELIPDGALAEIAASVGPGEKLDTEVVASLVVFGDLAGDEVVSQAFQFPVTICSDCVIGNLAPNGTLPACPLTSARAGNACNPYQDGIVDCCLQDGALVCPGAVPNN